jgi:spore maturation protein CgeB
VKLAFFVHSAVSDWNHGNAHFVRGLMDALVGRGHEVASWEPRDGWSLGHLLREAGPEAVTRFARAYPRLDARSYDPAAEDLRMRLAAAVRGCDAVIVHEWTEPAVIEALVSLRRDREPFELFFHDTHHRMVTAPAEIEALPLDGLTGVLAFGRSLAAMYRRRTCIRRAWVFHEAADVERFRPLAREREHDVTWIGNWGDEERSEELRAYWLRSARALQDLRFVAYGVRFPEAALREMDEAGVSFRGWAASLDVPEILARGRVTLHVPRRIYPERLPGIPTIRVFEALACGTPLVSTPWRDVEGLFRPGDYGVASTPTEMADKLCVLATDEDAAARQAERGLETVLARHTCAHRADQLIEILEGLGREGSDLAAAPEEATCA